MPPFKKNHMDRGWDAPLHSHKGKKHETAQSAEAARLDLSEEDLKKFEKIFETNSLGGAIDFHELPAALTSMDALVPHFTDADIRGMIHHYASNENGVLDMPEWLGLAATKRKDLGGLSAAFRAFDTDETVSCRISLLRTSATSYTKRLPLSAKWSLATHSRRRKPPMRTTMASWTPTSSIA